MEGNAGFADEQPGPGWGGQGSPVLENSLLTGSSSPWVSLSAGGRPRLGLGLRATGIFLAVHPSHLLGGLGDHSQRSPSA